MLQTPYSVFWHDKKAAAVSEYRRRHYKKAGSEPDRQFVQLQIKVILSEAPKSPALPETFLFIPISDCNCGTGVLYLSADGLER